MEDVQLFEHIRSALKRGLPEVEIGEVRKELIAVCGSGPSLKTEIPRLTAMRDRGIPIVAVRDAHDFLLSYGIVPTYALNVDPLDTAAECFKKPHKDVTYLIASQSNPVMFDYLKGFKVKVWHCYMQKGQKEPKDKLLIGGSTTSGLRAIAVAYVMGYRDFKLFGFDSCLEGSALRVNGTGPKPHEVIAPIKLEPDGEEFLCNPAMMLQANTFQDCYEWMPDAKFESFGRGLITEIIRLRKRDTEELEKIIQAQPEKNDRVSFMHAASPFVLRSEKIANLKHGDAGMDMASFRYRSLIPARELGWSINDYSAGTLIFSKPRPEDLHEMAKAKAAGKTVIVDFCDDHFKWMHYQEALRLADKVVCSTPVMAQIIKEVPRYGRTVDAVIPDPWEFPLAKPHFNGDRILWFGRDVNRDSLMRVLPDIDSQHVHIVSNFKGAIPWSHETMLREFAWADIVIIPHTEDYKSPNRCVEAMRQGCFVVAEPHPSLERIPGIWIGSIKEGLAWAKQQPPSEVRQRTSLGQSYVTGVFMPKTVTAMWKKLTEPPTTSVVETSSGVDGSMLTSTIPTLT